MSLASQINLLATRVASEFKSVRTSIAGKANSTHTHVKADVTDLGVVGNLTRVYFTGAAPARPAGAAYVDWVGPVQPAGMVAGDTWEPTA